MIKKALEYIVGMGEAKVQEYELSDGTKGVYTDKPLYRLETPIPVAETLYLHTLTGLVDYIKSGTDIMSSKMIVEVQSPTNVRLYSELNNRRTREYMVEVEAMIPGFEFNCFVDQENFCIGLQSKFIKNEDRELLLKFAGTVESGTVAQYGDDGVSQKATIKKGLASKGEAIIPSPARLRPYRTFLEVEQPESDFIFRMKDCGVVRCAIFEADGGAWKMKAMENIKNYLTKELEDMSQFTVIA